VTDAPKLVQRSIPIDRLMQEYGRVCLQLKFTEGELENARTAIESLQKALSESQENLSIATARLNEAKEPEQREPAGTN
jgi:hypothetical protein